MPRASRAASLRPWRSGEGAPGSALTTVNRPKRVTCAPARRATVVLPRPGTVGGCPVALEGEKRDVWLPATRRILDHVPVLLLGALDLPRGLGPHRHLPQP